MGKLQLVRALASVALLVLCQPAASSPALAMDVSDPQAVANADIYGRWRISEVLDYAAITDIGEREARRLVGKPVLISKEAFVFNGYECKTPGYERSVEETARSLREKGHVSSIHMGLPDPVTVVDASCTVFYLKRPGVIVVHWDGFYFDAVREKR